MMRTQFTAERKFGLSLGGALLILSGIIFFRKGSYPFFIAGAGMILLLSAMLIPSKLTMLKTGWLKAGWFLGQVNMMIILSLLYWICITPTGFLLKLLGKDLLSLKFNHKAETYWKDRAQEEEIDMKRQF